MIRGVLLDIDGTLIDGNDAHVGDTPYDLTAARRAGVAPIAVRSGGWSAEDLSQAVAVVRDVGELCSRLDELLGPGA